MTTKELLAVFLEDEEVNRLLLENDIAVYEGYPHKGFFCYCMVKECSCGREAYIRVEEDEKLLDLLSPDISPVGFLLGGMGAYIEALEQHMKTCDHRKRR